MSTKTQTTAEDLLERGHEFGPCELVEGEITPMEPGGFEHSETSVNVTTLLQNWARASRLGRVLGNEAGVITRRGPDTVRGAEAVYISYSRVPRGQRPTGFIDVAPELIVEVMGKGQTWAVMVTKAGEYLRLGADRVWIVDPARRRVCVFRADQEPQMYQESDSLTDPDVLPGFSCRVAELFED